MTDTLMTDDLLYDEEVEYLTCLKCGDEWPATQEFWQFRNGRPARPCKACNYETRITHNAVTPCCVPDCNEPRCRSYSSRCWTHQREWQIANYQKKKVWR